MAAAKTALILLPLMLWSAVASAAVVPKVESFDVSGSNAAELIKSIEAQNISDSGKKAWAITLERWPLQYRYTTKDGKVLVTSVSIGLELTVKLPRWKDYAQASKCLQANWDSTLRKLQAHEKGHVDIAIKYLPAVERSLKDQVKALGPQPSEQALKSRIDAVLSQAIVQNNEAQARYETAAPRIVLDPCP